MPSPEYLLLLDKMKDLHERKNIDTKTAIGVYSIQNINNGCTYIGSAARSFYARWLAHLSDLRCGKHHSRKLQMSWNKNGAACFVFDVIELVNARENVITREQFHLDDRRANHDMSLNYNTAWVAGSTLGVKKTPEEIARLRAAAKKQFSDPSHRKMISDRNKANWQSEEYREKFKERQRNNTGKIIRSKVYPGFISPDGQIYRDVTHLVNFASQHNLNLCGLCQIMSGEQTTHRGWRVYKENMQWAVQSSLDF